MSSFHGVSMKRDKQLNRNSKKKRTNKCGIKNGTSSASAHLPRGCCLTQVQTRSEGVPCGQMEGRENNVWRQKTLREAMPLGKGEEIREAGKAERERMRLKRQLWMTSYAHAKEYGLTVLGTRGPTEVWKVSFNIIKQTDKKIQWVPNENC